MKFPYRATAANFSFPPLQGKVEKRDSGGDFNDAVIRAIEAQAAGSAADVSSTAAVEAASGALARAFASAEVQAEAYARHAVTPRFLSQVGRDLVRNGDSMHVISFDGMGRLILIPASSWHFEGNDHPDSWTVRVTSYGPSTSTTRNMPLSGVVFVTWGSTPGQPYIGTGPLSWAALTAKLNSETERSLADEAAGPITNILAIPQDGGDGSDADPLKMWKSDIAAARGKATVAETTAAGWGEGKSAAPMSDYKPQRLGPNPPDTMPKIHEQSFMNVLAACGTPPSLFSDSDSQAQREALRRWHLNLVIPMARLLEYDLTMKLETTVKLKFDTYALDMVSRAQVVSKLTGAGVDIGVALAAVGLDAAES